MIENFFSPHSNWGLFILQMAAGIIFLVHGLPKLNPNRRMKGPLGFGRFFKQMGVTMPIFFGWVVASLVSMGVALLILDLRTHILTVLLALAMLAAILVAKLRVMQVGFSTQQATGWEFNFGQLAISPVLLFSGAGNIPLDPVLGL